MVRGQEAGVISKEGPVALEVEVQEVSVVALADSVVEVSEAVAPGVVGKKLPC
jgi:hypothetical protein